MKLFIGLGNPGPKYALTRHNVGFMALDWMADNWNISFKDEKRFKGQLGQGVIHGEKVFLLKPTTYMNLSGESVCAIMGYYEIDLADIIVIYDDLDLPNGKIRARLKGSAGGHNGIKSMIAHLGTQEFKRIRIGIDRHPKMSVVNYVLSKFSEAEKVLVNQAIDSILNFCEMSLTDSFTKAMTEFNR